MVLKNLRTGHRRLVIRGVLMTLLAVSLLAIMRHGAQFHAAAESQWAQYLELESQAFCRKFPLAAQNPSFAECVADLSEFMRRHEERVMQRSAGIL